MLKSREKCMNAMKYLMSVSSDNAQKYQSWANSHTLKTLRKWVSPCINSPPLLSTLKRVNHSRFDSDSDISKPIAGVDNLITPR